VPIFDFILYDFPDEELLLLRDDPLLRDEPLLPLLLALEPLLRDEPLLPLLLALEPLLALDPLLALELLLPLLLEDPRFEWREFFEWRDFFDVRELISISKLSIRRWISSIVFIAETLLCRELRPSIISCSHRLMSRSGRNLFELKSLCRPAMLRGVSIRLIYAEKKLYKMPATYISFDCATITLGYLVARNNLENSTPSRPKFASDQAQIEAALNARLGILSIELVDLEFVDYGVVNLIEGKKIKETSVRERIHALRRFLDVLTRDLDLSQCVVVVESQPGMNSCSNSIEDAIYMYFAYAKDVITIGSSRKNMICFAPALSMSDFCKSGGNAKKKHTAANLEYYCAQKGIPLNLPRGLYNHLGDAFMQLVAYLETRSHLTPTFTAQRNEAQ
jgi:hypothetical protein